MVVVAHEPLANERGDAVVGKKVDETKGGERHQHKIRERDKRGKPAGGGKPRDADEDKCRIKQRQRRVPEVDSHE